MKALPAVQWIEESNRVECGLHVQKIESFETPSENEFFVKNMLTLVFPKNHSSKFIFLKLCSKDVRLPVQLQRAMAAEAEAAREAR